MGRPLVRCARYASSVVNDSEIAKFMNSSDSVKKKIFKLKSHKIMWLVWMPN
jgi:hypothetical protein